MEGKQFKKLISTLSERIIPKENTVLYKEDLLYLVCPNLLSEVDVQCCISKFSLCTAYNKLLYITSIEDFWA